MTGWRQAVTILTIATPGRGFTDVTGAVGAWVRGQGIKTGLLTVFCRHTSASLLIQENASPAVLRDFQGFFHRLAPDDDALYEHDEEGPDDMPAHLRAALTQTHLSIPVMDGVPALGTWQGIFLCEHRHRAHRRELALHILGEG